MLRFLVKLPFKIIAVPIWLLLAAINILLVFLVGVSATFCYLIAGISVVTEVLSIGIWYQYSMDVEDDSDYNGSVCSDSTYRYWDNCGIRSGEMWITGLYSWVRVENF